jgi:hypothetical protein
MDNIKDLQKEIIELKQLYQDTKRSEIMLRNILDFLLNNEVPESKLSEMRESLKK